MSEAPNVPVPLEAETEEQIDNGDNDSAIGKGSSLASSTTSIGSSILKHRIENGRTYHAYKDGKYLVPNDEGENDRLDLQHHLYLLNYAGNLFICPIDKNKQIHRVLDIGTGTGIWAIDFGDEFPESKVLGVDLSPSQPAFVPPNVTFEIDDLDEDWTFSEKFDFIHSRMMTGALANWRKLFGQAFGFTTPGGYLEMTDVAFPAECDDGTMGPDSALRKWSDLLLDVGRKTGRDLDSAKFYKEEMEKAGYVDVGVQVDIWAMNRWPKGEKNKELGMWNCENLLQGLHGFTMATFTRVLGWTPEEVEVFVVDVRKEMKDTKIHAYWNIYTVYGRKPLE